MAVHRLRLGWPLQVCYWRCDGWVAISHTSSVENCDARFSAEMPSAAATFSSLHACRLASFTNETRACLRVRSSAHIVVAQAASSASLGQVVWSAEILGSARIDAMRTSFEKVSGEPVPRTRSSQPLKAGWALSHVVMTQRYRECGSECFSLGWRRCQRQPTCDCPAGTHSRRDRARSTGRTVGRFGTLARSGEASSRHEATFTRGARRRR